MQTDWKQIRELFNTVFAACEAYENLDIAEADRDKKLSSGEGTFHDLITSASTFPESMAYEVIRARHRGGIDNPYVSELSRMIKAAADLAAELVVIQPPSHIVAKQRTVQSEAVTAEISGRVDAVIEWYRTVYMVEMRRLEKNTRRTVN